MKIGIDCRLWNETGVGRYIRNLVLNLQELDRKNVYTLFVLPKDYEKIKSQISNIEKNWKLRVADVKWHTLDEQLKFPKILNKEDLDLVHFPYFSVPIFYNRPFVITIHDLIVNHFSTGQASTLPSPIYGLKRLAYNFILKQAAKKAKKIITVSNATKNEIVDHLGINPQKIAVIYESASKSLVVSSQKSVVRNKYFLYVGNAFPHKNLNKLLEAFKALDFDVKLVLVGKDDYFYKRLEDRVQEMNLSEKIIFLQDVKDEELSDLYKNAKALILPSLMEGFGLPALEAMRNSCLVLASKIPALQEICADAAIYFDPYDIKDITVKMKEACSNNNSDKKEKGLERAKLFSWSRMVKETSNIYEGCVGL